VTFFIIVLSGLLFLTSLASLGATIGSARANRRAKRCLEKASEAPSVKLLESARSVYRTLQGYGNLPEVRAKVGRLVKKIEEIEPKLAQLGSSTHHTVFATGTQYLPDAVNAFLRLPVDARSTETVDGQKTAKDLLCEQLDIMNAELDRVLTESRKIDATELVVHGRFLEEKYGKAEPVVEDVSEESEGPFAKIQTGVITAERIYPEPAWHTELDSEAITVRAGDGSIVAQYEVPKAAWVLQAQPPTPLKRVADTVLPTHQYDVRVTDAEVQVARSGNRGLRLTLVVTHGTFKGRRLWKTVFEGQSSFGTRFFNQQMTELGVEDGHTLLKYAGPRALQNMFVGRRLVATVKTAEWKGRTVNSVTYLTEYRY
jgi:hypothetical protein